MPERSAPRAVASPQTAPPWYINTMYDHNQLDVPDSFVALYLGPGGLKPGTTRVLVTARYELCEELAQHLHEYARAQHHDVGLGTDEVLTRCRQGMLAGPSGLNEAEARWVVRRLAELLEWAWPDDQPKP